MVKERGYSLLEKNIEKTYRGDDSSENEMKSCDQETVESVIKKKRQVSARKNIGRTHRVENNQGKEKLIESCNRKGVFSDDSSENQIKSCDQDTVKSVKKRGKTLLEKTLGEHTGEMILMKMK